MPKLHMAMAAGDVLLIPAGGSASIQFLEKSGKRAKVIVDSTVPVTITRAGTPNQPSSNEIPMAKRPVPQLAK